MSTPTPLTSQQKVLNEVLQTETTYIGSLQRCSAFFQELTEYQKTQGEESPQIKEILDIYNKILLPLISYQEAFYKDLQANSTVDNLTQSIDRYAKFFEGIYGLYAANYEKIIALITDEEKHNKKFNDFVTKYQHKQPVAIRSDLVTPIQRVPRYRLLLAELLKQTTESSEQAVINESLDKILITASNVNEAIRKAENLKTEENLQKLLAQNSPNSPASKNARTFTVKTSVDSKKVIIPTPEEQTKMEKTISARLGAEKVKVTKHKDLSVRRQDFSRIEVKTADGTFNFRVKATKNSDGTQAGIRVILELPKNIAQEPSKLKMYYEMGNMVADSIKGMIEPNSAIQRPTVLKQSMDDYIKSLTSKKLTATATTDGPTEDTPTVPPALPSSLPNMDELEKLKAPPLPKIDIPLLPSTHHIAQAEVESRSLTTEMKTIKTPPLAEKAKESTPQPSGNVSPSQAREIWKEREQAAKTQDNKPKPRARG